MKVFRSVVLIGVVFMLISCREGADEVPVEVQLRRAAAFRQSCAAAELLRTARDDLETLEALAAVSQNDAATISAASATVQFARGFQRHAELRAGAYALLDSAANHSPTPADSQRYVDRAGAFSISYPDAGTVEENVLQGYETKLQAILLDNDHRCNWDIPGLTPANGESSR